jgi:hypothetical protein
LAAFTTLLVNHGVDQSVTTATVDRLADLFTATTAPVDVIEADRAGMLPLPPVPLRLGWRNRVRLGRDYYVRFDTNDYSVDTHAIGRSST